MTKAGTATARSPSMSGRKPPAVLGSVATQPHRERVEHGCRGRARGTSPPAGRPPDQRTDTCSRLGSPGRKRVSRPFRWRFIRAIQDLIGEVGATAQTLDDDLDLQVAAARPRAGARRRPDPDIVGTSWQTGDDVLEEADPPGDGEGPLLGRVVQGWPRPSRHEHRRARDDVDVPIGHRVGNPARRLTHEDRAFARVSKLATMRNHNVVSPYFRALSASSPAANSAPVSGWSARRRQEPGRSGAPVRRGGEHIGEGGLGQVVGGSTKTRSYAVSLPASGGSSRADPQAHVRV